MSKISDMIEAAGARASAVSPMHTELLEHLENRIAALEALNVPRAKATPAPKMPDPAPAPEPAAEEA